MSTRSEVTSNRTTERRAIASARAALEAARSDLARHASALASCAADLDQAAAQGAPVGRHPEDGSPYTASAWLAEELRAQVEQLSESVRLIELDLATPPRQRVRRFLAEERRGLETRRRMAAEEARRNRLADRHDPRRAQGAERELRWLKLGRAVAKLTGGAWTREEEIYRAIEQRFGVTIRPGSTDFLAWSARRDILEHRVRRGRSEFRSPARADRRAIQ